MRRLYSQDGFSLLEALIAVSLLVIIITAAFEFYIASHQVVTSQVEVSDMQQVCRSSLNEIGRTVKMAGFRIGTHVPYSIDGDTLHVYYRGTQPIDTVTYYLQEFTPAEYQALDKRPAGQKLHHLMKKTNGAPEAIYSDFISRINFSVVDSTAMDITIEVCASRSDGTFIRNGGFRTVVNSQRVEMRNLSIFL
jgi:prepilin-type N-terminal cleavage/methylation domain-containing protein